MTETENKYFSVNIYDKNSISFHKSEEEAKEKCIKCAENLYGLATENDNFSLYEKRLNNAVYGVVLGKVESKTRELSEDEKRSINYFNCDYNVDAIIEKPEIVEFPQGNGWISIKEQLPELDKDVLVAFWTGSQYGIGFATYKKYYGEPKFVEPNYEYYGVTEVLANCDFWRPLPPPPKTE
ncbi:DUF551 domain-containing protein [Pasteurella sp. PK-2025]|uniref:DUF551 domain-containing protein n=1 Tax=Pasteurella sp. PK-2025 TaxID=3413133 RepID=UPI003C70C1AC